MVLSQSCDLLFFGLRAMCWRPMKHEADIESSHGKGLNALARSARGDSALCRDLRTRGPGPASSTCTMRQCSRPTHSPLQRRTLDAYRESWFSRVEILRGRSLQG